MKLNALLKGIEQSLGLCWCCFDCLHMSGSALPLWSCAGSFIAEAWKNNAIDSHWCDRKTMTNRVKKESIQRGIGGGRKSRLKRSVAIPVIFSLWLKTRLIPKRRRAGAAMYHKEPSIYISLKRDSH